MVFAAAALLALSPGVSAAADSGTVRQCAQSGAPILCRIHVNVERVQYSRWVLGMAPARYGWAAERTHSAAYRAWINNEWYRRSVPLAAATYIAPGLRSVIACISTHEEKGEGGANTSAGFYGFVNPVGVYPSPTAHRLAGLSWLSVALAQQRQIVAEIGRSYGFGGWATHGLCGV